MEKQMQITNFEKSMQIMDEVIALTQRILAREAQKAKRSSHIEQNIVGLEIQQKL